jgi:7-cyano-7-deazaguanine synthase
MNKAILLSGGMDSIALAFWKRPSVAITVDYGQLPAETEIRTSKVIVEALDMEHHVIRVNCADLGSGDLINTSQLQSAPSSEWWPYRNQLLLTLALMKGIKLGVKEIMVASVKSDGFHADGTQKFYELANSLSEYQESNIKITAPCIHLNTVELIKTSGVPQDLLFWAHSCHKSNVACGNCRGCKKYIQVMNELSYV